MGSYASLNGCYPRRLKYCNIDELPCHGTLCLCGNLFSQLCGSRCLRTLWRYTNAVIIITLVAPTLFSVPAPFMSNNLRSVRLSVDICTISSDFTVRLQKSKHCGRGLVARANNLLAAVFHGCVKPRIHDATRCTTGCTTGCIVYTQLYCCRDDEMTWTKKMIVG